MVAFSRSDPKNEEERLALGRADRAQSYRLIEGTQKLATFTSLTFSPDGSRVAFAAIDRAASTLPEPGRVQALGLHHGASDILGGAQRRLGVDSRRGDRRDATSVAFSANGRWLYVVGLTAFWRVEVRTKEATKLGTKPTAAQIVRLR